MANLTQGVPGVPSTPMVDAVGIPTKAWYTFFVNLWNRTGGAVASLSGLLDIISSVPGALIYRGDSVWVGIEPGSEDRVLRVGPAPGFPEWAFLDGKSFQKQSKAHFFAAPTAIDGVPVFRLFATDDLDNTAGQYPGTKTNDGAASGNIGEYLSVEIAQGSAVALTTATAADIATLSLPPGDWDVWGSLSTNPDVTTTQSDIRGWISTTSATDPSPPNNGAYTELNLAIAAGLSQTLAIGSKRVTVPAGPNATLYLSANVAFLVSTLSGYGFLGARRRR